MAAQQQHRSLCCLALQGKIEEGKIGEGKAEGKIDDGSSSRFSVCLLRSEDLQLLVQPSTESKTLPQPLPSVL